MSPKARCIAVSLLGMIGVIAFAPKCFALALLNDFYGLPAGLANDVVRIQETYSVNGGVPTSLLSGTGTIINIAPDGNGGNWYDVLTADHIARAPMGATLQGISIGFRFDSTYPLTVANLGVNIQYDSPVDLAVIGIDVPANAPPSVLQPLSLLQPVPIMAPNVAAGNQIVQAGYGYQATPVLNPVALMANGQPFLVNGQPVRLFNGWAYRVTVTPNSQGTYLAGSNTATGLMANFRYTDPGSGMNYMYNALLGSFAFTFNAMGNPASGTTYILPGDSGGPTFESDGMGGLDLIGVHSAIQFNSVGGVLQPFNWPGNMWADVNVSQYTTWITNAEKAANVVPEPPSLALLVVGLLALAVIRHFAMG
jgi:hypothetical protein